MIHKTNRFTNPNTLPKPNGYTHIVDTTGQRTIYISGQVAVDHTGKIVGVGDMKSQAEQVFINLESALKAVNAGFGDIARMTYYFVDITQLPDVREVRERYFNSDKYPASTVIQISGLVRKELMLEIEVTAVLYD